MTAPSHADRAPSAARTTPARAGRHQEFARFRKRLTAGNYDALLGLGLRRTLHAAAADPSLAPEIGALRLALTRLLSEEPDPARLATGIARLATVAVQAARLRAGPGDDVVDIRQIMVRQLALLDQEVLDQHQEPSRPDGD